MLPQFPANALCHRPRLLGYIMSDLPDCQIKVRACTGGSRAALVTRKPT